MKNHNDRYRHLAGYNKDLPLLEPDGLVRKGGIGTSTSEMTEENRKIIHEYTLEVLGPKLTHVLEHGGIDA